MQAQSRLETAMQAVGSSSSETHRWAQTVLLCVPIITWGARCLVSPVIAGACRKAAPFPCQQCARVQHQTEAAVGDSLLLALYLAYGLWLPPTHANKLLQAGVYQLPLWCMLLPWSLSVGIGTEVLVDRGIRHGKHTRPVDLLQQILALAQPDQVMWLPFTTPCL